MERAGWRSCTKIFRVQKKQKQKKQNNQNKKQKGKSVHTLSFFLSDSLFSVEIIGKVMGDTFQGNII